MVAIVAPLQKRLRALRALQAPEQVNFDPLTETWVVSSGAFRPQSDGTISVDLEEVQIRDGRDLTFGYPRIARAVGLVAHTVGMLEAASYDVFHDPVPGNDYHGAAAGKPSKSAARDLAGQCEIIVPINGSEARRHEDEKLARLAQKHAAG